MIYLERPEGFEPAFEAVGCLCEYEGKILLLHRRDDKPEGNKWGIPAGKIDANEDARQAILREVREEMGLFLEDTGLDYVREIFLSYPECDFVFHLFHAKLTEKPNVVICGEHKGFSWESPSEALEKPLVRDLDKYIEFLYNDS